MLQFSIEAAAYLSWKSSIQMEAPIPSGMPFHIYILSKILCHLCIALSFNIKYLIFILNPW